jgi:hypothetical protein
MSRVTGGVGAEPIPRHPSGDDIIPTGRTVDSNVNRRDAATCDSQSPLEREDCDDGSDHAFGAVGE